MKLCKHRFKKSYSVRKRFTSQTINTEYHFTSSLMGMREEFKACLKTVCSHHDPRGTNWMGNARQLEMFRFTNGSPSTVRVVKSRLQKC